MSKNLRNEYSPKLLDSAKKPTTDAIQTASKRAIQKALDATGNRIGNEIADKITRVSKKSLRHSQNDDVNNELEVPKERYIYFQKKDNKLLMN